MKSILVACPNPADVAAIQAACGEAYSLESVASLARCLELCAQRHYDFLFLDIEIIAPAADAAQKTNWKDALKPFWLANAQTEVIVLTPQERIRDAVSAVKAGAGNYLTLPVNPDELKYVLDSLLESKRMQSELDYLRDSFWDAASADIIRTQSPQMKVVFDKIRRVAPTTTTVLLSGETGTGKGVMAKQIGRAHV